MRTHLHQQFGFQIADPEGWSIHEGRRGLRTRHRARRPSPRLPAEPPGHRGATRPRTRFHALVAYARGNAPASSEQAAHLDALRRAEIIGEERIDPALGLVAQAVREPSLRVSVNIDGVDVTDDSGTCWSSCGSSTTRAAKCSPPGRCSCRCSSPSASALVRGRHQAISRSSPLPEAPSSTLGSPRAFEGGAGVALDEDSARSLVHLRSVSASLRHRWRRTLRWVPKPDAADGRSLEVIDSPRGSRHSRGRRE